MNKNHVGYFLKQEFLIPLKISQRQLARDAQLDICCVNEIIHGDRRITAEVDTRLTKLFGLSDGYFSRIQNEYEIYNAKVDKLNLSKLAKIKPINKQRSFIINQSKHRLRFA